MSPLMYKLISAESSEVQYIFFFFCCTHSQSYFVNSPFGFSLCDLMSETNFVISINWFYAEIMTNIWTHFRDTCTLTHSQNIY